MLGGGPDVRGHLAELKDWPHVGLYISPGPAKPVVDVGLSDGPGVQAYTTCKTSGAVEGRCVRGHVQAPRAEARGENWRGPHT